MADKGDGFAITIPADAFRWTMRNDIGYRLTGIFDVASYNNGLLDGQPAQPTVAIVSPNPTVQAGQPGGFPLDLAAARTTPVVLEVNAPDGIMLGVIVVRFRDDPGAEYVIYRRGKFRAGYSLGSYVEDYAPGIWRFHCVPDGGWRVATSNVLDDVTFDVDIAGGNDSLSLSGIGASS